MATKRVTKKEAREFYSEDIKNAPDRVLNALIRSNGEGFERGTPKAVKDALVELAIEEMIERGHPLPVFSAIFADI